MKAPIVSLCAGIALIVLMVTTVLAQRGSTDLTEFSLEDLMNVEVSSVSKRAQTLSQAASAIYVITQEDIRRSGATSIPDLLRMVPGIQVSQIDANKWAISSRGFNERFANKMLVLIDGRTVYTPLFSGVYWDVQDTLLEDLDRIEVIRGPGATLWGANAVNGVINILTKRAEDTQGCLVTAGGGTWERGFGGTRYGGELGQHGHYRLYAKYFNRGDFVDSLGQPAADQWDVLRGGFRSDWNPSDRNRFTLQGDVYDGRAGQTVSVPSLSPPFASIVDDRIRLSGGNLLARWNHNFSKKSDVSLQMYYDRTSRHDVTHGEELDTIDLDFQHHLSLGTRHDMVWGLGYRFNSVDLLDGLTLSSSAGRRDQKLFNVFLQDEILLARDRLRLTLGSKLEHNDYTGFEVQPTARLLWTPHHRHSIWGAVSRAIRTPSMAETRIRANLAGFPGEDQLVYLVSMYGNPLFKAEKLIAYELGYRVQANQYLSFDFASFYNTYHGLRNAEPLSPFLEIDPPPPHIVVPRQLNNLLGGDTYGAEIAANWNVTHYWQLSSGYTRFRAQLHTDPTSRDSETERSEDDSPRQQVNLRSSFKLPRHLELDANIYFMDKLRGLLVPSYTRLDIRFGWRPTESVDFSLGLQNLLDSHHPEYSSADQLMIRTEFRRNLYGKITWRF